MLIIDSAVSFRAFRRLVGLGRTLDCNLNQAQLLNPDARDQERRMVANARRPAQPGTNPFWLNELKEAHESLLGAIGELAELTRGSVPSKGELASVRWRLSAASLSRRLIWGRIHAFLSRRVSDPSVDRDLRLLQETDMRLMRTSTEHVGRWSLDAILGDWAGYCQASEAMRRKMADAISQEKQLLYPIIREIESDS